MQEHLLPFDKTQSNFKAPEFKPLEFKTADFKTPEFKTPEFKTPEFKLELGAFPDTAGDLQIQVNRLEDDIRTYGAEPPVEQSQRNILEWLFDQISRTNFAKNSALQAVTRGEDVGKAALDGWGLRNRVHGWDLLEEWGISDGWQQKVLGFAFDVVTDPLTYLTFGKSNAARASLGVTETGARALTPAEITEMGRLAREPVLRMGTGVPFSDRAVNFITVPLNNSLTEPLFRAGSVARRKLIDETFAGSAIVNWKRAFTYGYRVPEPVLDFADKFFGFKAVDSDKVKMGINQLREGWRGMLNDLPTGQADNLDIRVLKYKEADAAGKAAMNLPAPLVGIADDVTRFFNDCYRLAWDNGIEINFMEDYVTHIFRGAPEAKRVFFNQHIEEITPALTAARGRGVSFSYAKQREIHLSLAKILENSALTEKLKPVTDIADIMCIYKTSLMKTIRHKQAIDEFVGLGPEIISRIRTAPVTYIPVGDKIPQLSDFAVHPEVHRFLGDVTTLFRQPEEVQKMLGLYDKAFNYWKAVTTLPRPSFHLRNHQSGFVLNYFGGMRRTEPYKFAGICGKLHQRRMAGEIISVDEIAKLPKIMTQDGLKDILSVYTKAWEQGATKAGFVHIDLKDVVTQSMGGLAKPQGFNLKFRDLNPFARTGGWMRYGETYALNSDAWHRSALFFDRVIKGDTFNAAMKKVKACHYHYDELTKLEKTVMRRSFFFYTWIRKNIPRMIGELVKQPGIFGKLGHFQAFMQHLPEDEDVDLTREHTPDWMRRLYSVRLPFQVEGQYITAGFDLPFRDFNTLEPKELITSLTPFALVPFQLVSNRDLFFGNDIKRFEDHTVRAPGYLQGFLHVIRAEPEGSPLVDWWQQVREQFGIVEVMCSRSGEKELRIPVQVNYLLRQILVMKDLGRVLDVTVERAWPEFTSPLHDEALVASPLIGVAGTSINKEEVATRLLRKRKKHLEEILELYREYGVTAPRN